MDDNTAQLATIFGFALLPFVVSIVYGCTACGSKKVPWIFDILALGIAAGVFWAVQHFSFLWLKKAAASLNRAEHWWILAADLLGFVAVAFALPITYKILYAGGGDASGESAPAH